MSISSSLEQWFSLEGKTVAVVGASKGLGREIALAVSQAGARVACVARTPALLEETADLIRSGGGDASTIVADVTKEEDMVRMGQELERLFDKLDVLFYSAGVLEAKPSLNTKIDEWHRILDTNLTGAFLACREAGRIMKAQGGGRIILLATTFADRVMPFVISYMASKGGVLQLVRNLAWEWARYGIRVNGIAPGLFATEMPAKGMEDPKVRDHLLSRIPLRRIGEPAEIGPLAVYMASKAADYMTGEVVRIDGGQGYNIS